MHLQAGPPSHASFTASSALEIDEDFAGAPLSSFSGTDSGPLRILLIVEASVCGTGRHVLDLAEGLIERGHEVHLVYSTVRCDQLFRQRLAGIKGVSCQALPMQTPPHISDLHAVRAIRKLRAEHGPFDIIHGHSSKGGALARLVAMGTGAKTFYTPHGIISLDLRLPWWKHRFYTSIERLLARWTDRIIAVSPEEARAAAEAGLDPAKIITIPNGLEELQLTPRETARRTMGLSDCSPSDGANGETGREVVVGFVGRLVEQKGPEVLLESFALATAEMPNARLAMVGDGPMLDGLKSQADALGITAKIIWLGERDAREVFSGFDLFALASRKEGLPYVVLEAMSAGLPVIATFSSGVEILVDQDVNGIVVDTDNVAAFSQALQRVLQSPELLARFGAASKTLVSRFTIDKMVDETLRSYRTSLQPSVGADTVRASIQ